MIKNKILVVTTSFLLAMLVLFQNTMEVSAANVYTGLRNFPGKELQIGSYEYGTHSVTIKIPYGYFSSYEDGYLTFEDMNFDITTDNSTISGTVTENGYSITQSGTGNTGSYIVPSTTDKVNLTVKNGDSTVDLNYGHASYLAENNGFETYTFDGAFRIEKTYLFNPDRLQLFGVDYAKVWMHNFGWTEALTGSAYGTVESSSYVVDTTGNRHDLADGSNLFLYELPEGQMTIITEVKYSAVIYGGHADGDDDGFCTFSVRLTPRTSSDTWYAWPLQRYYDYGEVVDALQGGYDNPDAGGAVGGLDGSLGGYEDAEGEITGGAIDDLDNFTIDGEGISGYAESLLTVFPLVSAMMQSIFVSSGNLAIIITAGFTLTIVCILLGVAKFHMR